MASVVTAALKKAKLVGFDSDLAFSARDGTLINPGAEIAKYKKQLADCETGSFPDMVNQQAIMADLERRLADLKEVPDRENEAALIAELERRQADLVARPDRENEAALMAELEQRQAALVEWPIRVSQMQAEMDALRAAYEEQQARVAIDPQSANEQEQIAEQFERLLALTKEQEAKLNQLELDAKPGVYEEGLRLFNLTKEQEVKIVQMEYETKKLERKLDVQSRNVVKMLAERDTEIRQLKAQLQNGAAAAPVAVPVSVRRGAKVGLATRPPVFSTSSNIDGIDRELWVRVEDVKCEGADFARAARGTYGCVYLCSDKRAIKLGKIREHEREMCVRASEVGISPHVYSVTRVATTNQMGAYERASLDMITMDSVGPDTLHTFVTAEYSPESVAPVLEGLFLRMQQSGLVHADFKANNIMMDHTGSRADRAWAIDWGIVIQPTDTNRVAVSYLQFLCIVSFLAVPDQANPRAHVEHSALSTVMDALRRKKNSAAVAQLTTLRKRYFDAYQAEWGVIPERERVMTVLWPYGAPQTIKLPAPVLL